MQNVARQLKLGGMAAAEVKVSGSLYLPWLRVESQTPTLKTEFTAMIRVKAPPLSVCSNAPPIHLVVLLDVSVPSFDLLKMMEFIKGEFHGDVTQDHRVDVVNHLFGDSISSKLFGDSITNLMPINDWISQEKKKSSICMRKDGTTNLKLILERTLEAVKKRCRSYESHVGFIILISDGESKFECDDCGFERELRGYPVHAFGIGKNHDPKVLHRIAEVSRGTYSSVPVADTDTEDLINNSKLVMEAMALCLGGLKSVVAIDTRVKISVPDRDDTAKKDTLIIQDLKIVEIQSGGYERSIDSDGRTGEICIGLLYADEVKDFIVRLQFKSYITSLGDGWTRSSVLTAAVEYYKDISSKQQHLPKTSKQRVVPLLVTSSDDEGAREAFEELEQQAPNPRVLRQMILFQVVQMLLRFANDNTTTNNVGNLLRDMWEKLRSEGNKKRAKENDLVHLYKYLKMARENDLVDLQGIDEAMDAMASCLQSRQGLGCIYSWVSGYQMQRATTTGFAQPPPRALFLTPAMEAAARNVSKHLAVDVDLQATRRLQSAIALLEKLERMFDDDDSDDESRYRTTIRIGEDVADAIRMIGRGKLTATASRSDDNKEMPIATKLRDHLKDDIKSTIAIRLFNCLSTQFFEKKGRDRHDWEEMYMQMYADAQVAIKYWRHVQGEIMSSSGRQYESKVERRDRSPFSRCEREIKFRNPEPERRPRRSRSRERNRE